jgi:hypothetical protein
MTAANAPFRVDGIVRHSDDHVAPFAVRRPLAASAQPYQFYLVTGSASGNKFVGAPAPSTAVPDTFLLGAADRDTVHVGAVDGAAEVIVYQQWLIGYSMPAPGADAFVDTDYGAVGYVIDNQTIGKLSNSAGVNRSMGPIFLGLDKSEQNKPEFAIGPMYTLLARAVHHSTNASGGAIYKVIDAGAGTDTVNTLAEALVPRAKLHGQVQAVEFVVDGTTLAASGNTDFTALTLQKRDGVGGAPVTVATVTTKTLAFTQWTAVQFTLSAVAGATDLLETDLLTLVKTHGGAGAIVPSGSLRVIEKVQ